MLLWVWRQLQMHMIRCRLCPVLLWFHAVRHALAVHDAVAGACLLLVVRVPVLACVFGAWPKTAMTR